MRSACQIILSLTESAPDPCHHTALLKFIGQNRKQQQQQQQHSTIPKPGNKNVFKAWFMESLCLVLKKMHTSCTLLRQKFSFKSRHKLPMCLIATLISFSLFRFCTSEIGASNIGRGQARRNTCGL